ncbi:SelB C-terminal domain-containing protein, partial [bacterium]|nr:SelB C-terminal domain-containing protein [bacterium]
PIIPCSGITGGGLDELRAAIAAVAARLPERGAGALARLPIDRSFSMAGHGTVVTGTVFHGALHEGEEVVVLPRGERARVRGLQSHGQAVERVSAGQRAAINLAGIKHHELSRGDVVCTQGAFLPTLMVDGRVELDTSVGAPLRHGASVGFHLGTAEVPGRLALLDRDALPPGDQAWAQVRLSAPVVARRGDRFILRTVGGDATLGGGFVLDAHPVKHRRHRAEAAERLECLAAGGLEEAVAQELSNAGTPLRLGTLRQRLGEEHSAVEAAARAHGHLAPSGGDPWVYDDALLERARESIEAALAEHHARKPLLPTGLTAAELAAKMGFARAVGDDLVTAMATALEAAGHVRRVGITFVSADHQVTLSARQQAICDHILDACRQSPFAPPTVADLAEQLGATSAADVAAVHESLLATGQLVDGGVCGFHPEAIAAAWQRIEAHLRQHGQATVSALREALGTSRRYALPLLQHFDALGRLVREGDQRRLPDPA